MEAREVSNIKSDLQGHSRALVMVPVDWPHTISYWSSIATMYVSCTLSGILSLISQNVNRSRDPEHISFGGNISCMH